MSIDTRFYHVSIYLMYSLSCYHVTAIILIENPKTFNVSYALTLMSIVLLLRFASASCLLEKFLILPSKIVYKARTSVGKFCRTSSTADFLYSLLLSRNRFRVNVKDSIGFYYSSFIIERLGKLPESYRDLPEFHKIIEFDYLM